jgi:hypothetical protein
MTELDEYHIAIQKLQAEIEKYRDAASTLEDVADSLMAVQQVSAEVRTSQTAFMQDSEVSLRTLNNKVEGSLSGLSQQVAATLNSIRSLNLEELHTETQSRYQAHQARLDQLGKEVESAVREQQRQGLEMLQHTTALQNELSRYADQVEQSSRVWNDRQGVVETQLQTIAAKVDATAAQLAVVADHAAQVNKLVRLAIVLVVIVGVISVAV